MRTRRIGRYSPILYGLKRLQYFTHKEALVPFRLLLLGVTFLAGMIAVFCGFEGGMLILGCLVGLQKEEEGILLGLGCGVLILLMGLLSYAVATFAFRLATYEAPKGHVLDPAPPEKNEALTEEQVQVRGASAPSSSLKSQLLRVASTDEEEAGILLRSSDPEAHQES